MNPIEQQPLVFVIAASLKPECEHERFLEDFGNAFTIINLRMDGTILHDCMNITVSRSDGEDATQGDIAQAVLWLIDFMECINSFSVTRLHPAGSYLFDHHISP